ncbi:MAG: NAD(P)-dependent alcohol dehydrogenase [Bacteroidetes bacterium]|nr:MAG: NAD(P)-dependent alcohol dehydrogenase [Bacteroidota bacterium]
MEPRLENMHVAIQGEMRAAVAYRYGGPEVVEIAQIPIPVFTEKEVLIEVHYSTVNRTDTGFRRANYVVSRLFSGLLKPKSPVWGSEFYGKVIAAGSACSYLKVGDFVCGFDDSRFGAHAQYMAIAENAGLCVVEETDKPEIAVLMEGGHYALSDIRAARLAAGDLCLVFGASGAIGSAAVQILKSMHMRVIAVSLEEHLDQVKGLGADEVYSVEEFQSMVPQASLDFLFDAVGKLDYADVKHLIKPVGSYISTEMGKGFKNIWRALFGFLLPGPSVKFPIPLMRQEDAKFLYGLYQMGKFKPLIDREYALDEIQEAHRYAESGMKLGNLIIRIKD